MSIIKKHKINKRTKFSQILLIDAKGFLQKSCDSIFPTHNLVNTPAYEWMPFMESIFESLLLLKTDSPEVRFTKVEMPANFLPGYYDFTFSKVKLEDAEGILWCVFDYTELYINLMRYQQQHNELEIHRQLFELGNQEIQHSSEIHDRKYFFQTYFNLKRTNSFYSKIQDLLLSSENILDVFTILKNESALPSSDDLNQTITAFSKIEQDYKVFLNLKISTQNKANSFLIPTITQETQNILQKKLGKKLPIYFDIGAYKEQSIIADSDLLKQILFNFILVFFEQMPQESIHILFSVIRKDDSLSYLNIHFSGETKEVKEDKIQQPSSMVLRLSLIKKLVQSASGRITTLNNSSSKLDLIIQIPCHSIL